MSRSVPKKYEAQLLDQGIITSEEVKIHRETTLKALEQKLEETAAFEPDMPPMAFPWSSMTWNADSIPVVQTGASLKALQDAGKASVAMPDNFVSSSGVDGLIVDNPNSGCPFSSGETACWETA